MAQIASAVAALAMGHGSYFGGLGRLADNITRTDCAEGLSSISLLHTRPDLCFHEWSSFDDHGK